VAEIKNFWPRAGFPSLGFDTSMIISDCQLEHYV